MNLCNCTRIVALVLLLSVHSSGPASAQEKSKLTEHVVRGAIRVFYTNEGPDAVPPTDVDRNGVPDRVEDVVKQLWAARELFCGELKFQDPIGCDRYPKVTCIEARLRNREELGHNGVAFESAQRARPIPEGKESDRALVMTVATTVNPITNATPAHEFFHLIQYGSTYFKNRWYLEGQARWAEHALGKEGLGEFRYDPRGPWPQRTNNLQQLVEMTYDAEFVLWNPMARATDARGVLPKLPAEFRTLKYSDGSPVVVDNLLTGHVLMREILSELGEMDDVAFAKLKYDEWSEENQRSPANNPFVYEAIMNVLRRHHPRVGRFKASPALSSASGTESDAGHAESAFYDSKQKTKGQLLAASDTESDVEDAESAFYESEQKAREQLLADFDTAEKRSQRSGDLDGLTAARDHRKAFTERGELPDTSAARVYARSMAIAGRRLSSAYANLIREYTRDGNIDAAIQLRKRHTAFKDKGTLPDRPAVLVLTNPVGISVAKIGENMYDNRPYKWEDLPEQCIGWNFSKHSLKNPQEYVVDVQRPGVVYLYYSDFNAQAVPDAFPASDWKVIPCKQTGVFVKGNLKLGRHQIPLGHPGSGTIIFFKASKANK